MEEEKIEIKVEREIKNPRTPTASTQPWETSIAPSIGIENTPISEILGNVFALTINSNASNLQDQDQVQNQNQVQVQVSEDQKLIDQPKKNKYKPWYIYFARLIVFAIYVVSIYSIIEGSIRSESCQYYPHLIILSGAIWIACLTGFFLVLKFARAESSQAFASISLLVSFASMCLMCFMFSLFIGLNNCQVSSLNALNNFWVALNSSMLSVTLLVSFCVVCFARNK